MKKVVSSHISHVDHDGKTMTITFSGGETYTYPDVPTTVYNALLNAKSIGEHFVANIKHKYKATKVE